MGMGMSPLVTETVAKVAQECGAGAGGTRNISGTNHYHVLLEQELADWTHKDAALLFTSGYVANMTALATLGRHIPDLVMFSDSENHNSMIEGIRHGRAPKHVFRHNDVAHLDELLGQYPKETPKIIIFESVYSMDGDIAPIGQICDVAEKHNAMTFLDEVHAVGMYGEQGSGVAERDGVLDRITLYQATMGKAIGLIGGFVTGSADAIDFIRSFGQRIHLHHLAAARGGRRGADQRAAPARPPGAAHPPPGTRRDPESAVQGPRLAGDGTVHQPHRAGDGRRRGAVQAGFRCTAQQAPHLRPADQLSDRAQGQRTPALHADPRSTPTR